MTANLPKLKELAQAAQQNQYDPVALNDYGMAVPPATVLDLIAEIERHRQINAEGCKPDSNILLAGLPCADVAPCSSLDKEEGCKPDLLNLPHQGIAALREDIQRGNRIQFAMALDLSAIAEALGIPPDEQQGGAPESIAAIQDLRTQLAAHADLLDHWLQLANVCDDRNTDLMRETRALLDGTSPAWSRAASDLLAERRRQIELKGYNSEHDDHYGCEELTAYAVVHALLATGTSRDWAHLSDICEWKVKDDEPRRMLIKAAALLLASLESLDRQLASEVHP